MKKCYVFEVKRYVRIWAHDDSEAFDECQDKIGDEEEIERWERDADYDEVY